MPTKVTTESFIAKSKLVHNNKYDYSQTVYTQAKEKVSIICPIHGSFEQRPDSHSGGAGCPICGREAKASTAKSEFSTKSTIIHNSKYDYSLVDYKNCMTKVSILCPIHGEFQQKPNDHLSGKGCALCALSETGWTRTKFKEKCIKNNDSLGILYILECFNDNERFIKIGITSNSVKKRYHSKASMPYSYTILHEIIGSPEFIYDLETLLHRKSCNYRYIPITSFGGSLTECFEADPTYLSKLNDYLDFKKEEGVS